MYFEGKCSQQPNLNMDSCTVDFILTLVHKRNIQLHFHLGGKVLFPFRYDEKICFNKYRIHIYKIQKIKQVTDLILCMLMKLYLDYYRSFSVICCLQTIFIRSLLMNIRLFIHFRLYLNSFRKGFVNIHAKYF